MCFDKLNSIYALTSCLGKDEFEAGTLCLQLRESKIKHQTSVFSLNNYATLIKCWFVDQQISCA